MSNRFTLHPKREITPLRFIGQIHGHFDSRRRCAIAFVLRELKQIAKRPIGIGPEISESVKTIYDAAGVRVFSS